MELYHYTDKAGYDGINKDRFKKSIVKKSIAYDYDGRMGVVAMAAASALYHEGVVAMAAVAGAGALYSHLVGRREGRLQNLQNELETILNRFKADRRLADDANCYT
eukprot:scaffold11767_cov64-Cylindrotheca_fusiformis.AAC.1